MAVQRGVSYISKLAAKLSVTSFCSMRSVGLRGHGKQMKLGAERGQERPLVKEGAASLAVETLMLGGVRTLGQPSRTVAAGIE